MESIHVLKYILTLWYSRAEELRLGVELSGRQTDRQAERVRKSTSSSLIRAEAAAAAA